MIMSGAIATGALAIVLKVFMFILSIGLIGLYLYSLYMQYIKPSVKFGVLSFCCGIFAIPSLFSNSTV